jgi:hypothetical protein
MIQNNLIAQIVHTWLALRSTYHAWTDPKQQININSMKHFIKSCLKPNVYLPFMLYNGYRFDTFPSSLAFFLFFLHCFFNLQTGQNDPVKKPTDQKLENVISDNFNTKNTSFKHRIMNLTIFSSDSTFFFI